MTAKTTMQTSDTKSVRQAQRVVTQQGQSNSLPMPMVCTRNSFDCLRLLWVLRTTCWEIVSGWPNVQGRPELRREYRTSLSARKR